MSYQRPTLPEIIKNIEADIYARFQNEASTARFSVNKVLARVVGGACHLLYGKIQLAMKQLLPDTCDEYFLKRWAQMYSIQQKAANKSFGTAVFEGKEGTVVPLYSQWQTADHFVFQTTEKGTINPDGKVEVSICAMQPGARGNLKEGTQLVAVTPIVAIRMATLGCNGTHSGSDIEDIEKFRERLLFRISNPVCAGTAEDYKNWMLEVEGVTRAYCYSCYPEKGSIGLAFLRDNDDEQIPNQEQNDRMKNTILSKCPITAEIVMVTLEKIPMNFHFYIAEDNLQIKQQCTKIIQQVIREISAPSFTIERYQIEEALRSEKIIFKTKYDNIDTQTVNCDVKTNDKQIQILGNIEFSYKPNLILGKNQ
jgi:uncharacterized phage protein gp47/JayE